MHPRVHTKGRLSPPMNAFPWCKRCKEVQPFLQGTICAGRVTAQCGRSSPALDLPSLRARC